ncbi:MAG: hypothetical protein H7X80_07560, partial [bacterium]|nr:hypothetical protein [Candidatus Kapabacteria bacterium]
MAKVDQDVLVATENRLGEIELELGRLTEVSHRLKAQWQLEKELIARIRGIKSEIEDVKQQAAEFERHGDLAKVAELRYGRELELERELVEANARLEEA